MNMSRFNKPLPLDVFAKKVKAKRKSRHVVLEKTIEKNVKKYARSIGVVTRKYVSTAHPSVPDDIFFFDNGIIIFIEFKRPGKKLTGNQARELYLLQSMGHLIYVVNNEAVGVAIIDYYADLAANNHRPQSIYQPTEKQWQEISTSKDRITAAA